jgi:hypothetical protein
MPYSSPGDAMPAMHNVVENMLGTQLHVLSIHSFIHPCVHQSQTHSTEAYEDASTSNNVLVSK